MPRGLRSQVLHNLQLTILPPKIKIVGHLLSWFTVLVETIKDDVVPSLVYWLKDLKKKGFPALALDLCEFGESENPPTPLTEDFRFEDDVSTAARYTV